MCRKKGMRRACGGWGRGRGSCCCSLNGRALAGICVALRAGNVWTVPRQRCRLVVVGCSVQRRRAESHSLLRFVPRLVRKDCAAVSLRAVSSEFQRQGPALHRSAPLSWPCIWPQCAYANSPLQCRCWHPSPRIPQSHPYDGSGRRGEGGSAMGWESWDGTTDWQGVPRASVPRASLETRQMNKGSPRSHVTTPRALYINLLHPTLPGAAPTQLKLSRHCVAEDVHGLLCVAVAVVVPRVAPPSPGSPLDGRGALVNKHALGPAGGGAAMEKSTLPPAAAGDVAATRHFNAEHPPWPADLLDPMRAPVL